MNRSINSRTFLVLALALSSSLAHADYQQTLAAQGADAFTAPEVETHIDEEALANTFATDMVEVNPALSDQEVMLDLQARIAAEQRLEAAAAAAAALDPTAPTDGLTATTASKNETPPTDTATDTTAETAVASR